MPLIVRPKNNFLAKILEAVLAGDIITDISQIGTLRQFAEGVAADLADLSYDDYTLLRSFYVTTAAGEDLDARLRDHGLTRDAGQAASDAVTYTRVQTWLEDIALPVPQVLQATLADGTAILYRSIGAAALFPQGRSISGQAPGTLLVSGANDQLRINLDGDGAQTITLGTQTTAAAIAAVIQSSVRALTAASPGNQPAYAGFRCDYDLTTPGVYTLRSGSTGPTSTVVLTAGTVNNAAVTLKLGLINGGEEIPGEESIEVAVLCDTIGILGNVGAGQIQTQVSPVDGILSVGNALMFANGREPASDDAYRQDGTSYLLSLARGTQDAIERAVAETRDSAGVRHVMSSQVLYGAGVVQVYVCDGRSLTVGAQNDVVQDVQDELDGLLNTVGAWYAAGAVAGVAPAVVYTVDVTVTVQLGPTPDLVLAQQAIRTALYTMLYQWPIGEALSYVQMTRRIDETVAEMLGVTFTQPVAFSTNPPTPIPALIGRKVMPGILAVEVIRA